MEQELKQIQCEGQCGFMVRSRDEKEVISMAKKHLQEVHKTAATDTDLRSRISTIRQTAGVRS